MIMVFLRKSGVTLLLIAGTTFAFILTMFVVWGARGSINPFRIKEPVALRINQDEVSQENFERVVENIQRQYNRANLSQAEIERRAIEQIINQVLLQQQIQALDVNVGKQEVDERIWQAYEYDLYRNLSQRGLGKQYWHQVEQSLELERLRQLIENLAFITDEELQDAYKERNEKVKIKFIAFRNSEFLGAVQVSDEEAQAYFEAHREDYRIPDRVAIEYVKIDPEVFAQPVEEKDIRAYYDANRLTEFTAPEGQIWARHILFKLDENADEAKEKEVLERAKKVLEEARSGADFAELARKYSEGPTASKGGDLGFFGKGQMVKEFEEAAFALQEGEISEPVRSPFGYHIIKREPNTKPYDLVKDEIRKKLEEERQSDAASEARSLARDLLYDFQAYGFEEAITKETYQKAQLELKKTPLFSKQDSNIENLGYRWDHQPLIDAVFDLRPGDISDVIEVKLGDRVRGYYIARVIDRQPSHLPAFDEVKDTVVSDLKRQKAAQLAYDTAAALMKKREDAEDLESLAKKYEPVKGSIKEQVTVEETDRFAFASHGYVPRIGSAPEIMAVAFAMKPGELRGPIQVKNLGSYLIELAERQEADMAAFESNLEEKLKLYQELLTQKKNQIYQMWLDAIKAHSHIERVEFTPSG